MSNFKGRIHICANEKMQERFKELICELSCVYNAKFLEDTVDENDYVIIFGGDGSLNYAINNFESIDKAQIVYIPTGTANDFARSLKISYVEPKISMIEQIIKDSQSISVPLMKCNEKYFINAAVGGSLADVTSSGDELLKKVTGKLSYYLGAVEKFVTAKLVKFDLQIKDHIKSVQTYGFLVSQGLYAGGGAKVSTRVVPSFQEKFNFFTPNTTQLLESVEYALRIQKRDCGDFDGKDLINRYERKVCLSSKKPIKVKIDGEEYSAKELCFEKSKRSLNFLIY